MSCTLALNINVDVAELVKIALKTAPSKLSYSSQTLDGGNGRWISCQTGGKVISACFHKTKNHSATVQTGIWPFIHQSKSTASPGEWAVAYRNSEPGVDKTLYNF